MYCTGLRMVYSVVWDCRDKAGSNIEMDGGKRPQRGILINFMETFMEVCSTWL